VAIFLLCEEQIRIKDSDKRDKNGFRTTRINHFKKTFIKLRMIRLDIVFWVWILKAIEIKE